MPSAELFGIEVAWDEKVYEPYEDTILLAEGVDAEPGMACLELATGTGLVALILAREAGAAVATDINPHACRLARENAERNDLLLDVVCMDMADALDAPFDVIAVNPPYLPTAPEDKLEGIIDRTVSGGPDGAELTRRVLEEIAVLLAPEGKAWLIVSSKQPVAELNEQALDLGLTWTVETEEAMGGFEHLARVRLEREDPEAIEPDPPEDGPGQS